MQPVELSGNIYNVEKISDSGFFMVYESRVTMADEVILHQIFDQEQCISGVVNQWVWDNHFARSLMVASAFIQALCSAVLFKDYQA